MKLMTRVAGAAAVLATVPMELHAAVGERARQTGVSGIWILANLSYAGMRAQGSSNSGGRAVAFLFGLPGTLLTYFVVAEGEERAYGVELPRGTDPRE